MLPEAKHNLKVAKFDEKIAGLITMACFIGGFVGIQAFTRFLHQFMPSHVVDCDHTHNDDITDDDRAAITHNHGHGSSIKQTGRTGKNSSVARIRKPKLNGHQHHDHDHNESTPLLNGHHHGQAKPSSADSTTRTDEMTERLTNPAVTGLQRTITTPAGGPNRRSSMADVQKRVISFVKDTKCDCIETGSCYGYTDPCGQECFKHLSNKSSPIRSRHPTVVRTASAPFRQQSDLGFPTTGTHAPSFMSESYSPRYRSSLANSHDLSNVGTEGHEEDEHSHEAVETDETAYEESSSAGGEDIESQQHHHHVPTNAFLSIGLQTSIAIAIHKFPEGFVTYATNHANPTLGLNIFLALFVHNICEGFTLALPLYMALNSRIKALAWASILGGLSQPLGALLAFIVLEASKNSHMAPDAVTYACLFAITAGMMVSVALQLFVESLSLNHNRNICIFFGFLGMVLLGLSNVLFGEA